MIYKKITQEVVVPIIRGRLVSFYRKSPIGRVHLIKNIFDLPNGHHGYNIIINNEIIILY